jgi:3-oxoacyl-[acyl-carrier protein] reductase
MVMDRDSERVAVVTGGSRGIGRAVVERLARDGWAVGILSASDSADARSALAAAREAGVPALSLSADVADEAAVASAFDEVEQDFGGIDAVVQAAGRMSLGPLVDFDLAELDAMHRTNIRGTFVVDQQAARRLRPGGSILNFSSSVVGRVLPGYTGYAASKGAVDAITLILANELRGRDVSVNAIAPGPTATAMFLDGKDEATIERLATASPLERLATPDDIARAVAFLIGPDGHWINGQVIRANGGVL